MKIGFYAGSFDPFTNGHLHVVKEASKLFDKLYVGIGVNTLKPRHFKQEEMQELFVKVLKREKINNVEVVIYDGLSVECAKKVGAGFLVRGIRNGMDYDYEENLAKINEELSGLDTIYVRAGAHGFISSSFVRDLVNNKQDVSKYVPSEIAKYLKG